MPQNIHVYMREHEYSHVDQVKSSQKSFNKSRDRKSADTAATEFVTEAINIIVKSIIILEEKTKLSSPLIDGPRSSFISGNKCFYTAYDRPTHASTIQHINSINSFIHSGHFSSAPSSPLLL